MKDDIFLAIKFIKTQDIPMALQQCFGLCEKPNKPVLFKQIVFSSTPNMIETVPIYGNNVGY